MKKIIIILIIFCSCKKETINPVVVHPVLTEINEKYYLHLSTLIIGASTNNHNDANGSIIFVKNKTSYLITSPMKGHSDTLNIKDGTFIYGTLKEGKSGELINNIWHNYNSINMDFIFNNKHYISIYRSEI